MLKCLSALILVLATFAPSTPGAPGPGAPTQPTTKVQTKPELPAPGVPAPGVPGALNPDPKKLVVQSATGDKEVISLSLQTSVAAEVRGFVPQLTTADGARRLPRGAIKIIGNDQGTIALEANFPKEVQIEFDSANAASGEYAGDLVFYRTTGGNPATVPITVRLKDRIWGALIVLAVSLGISVILSSYRSVGRKRDLLILRMAPIQELLKDDSELDQFREFWGALNAKLQEVSRQVKSPSPDLSVAEAAATEAEAIARRWQDWRARWVDANKRLGELLKHANISSARAESDAAATAMNNAPLATNPDTLERAIKALDDKLNPGGGGAPLAAPAKSGRAPFSPHQLAVALWRKNGFEILSYITAILLLYFVGVKELYVGNPTFGANCFVDYFSLIVWGFGAEATRASVVSMIRTWGIQGFT